MPKLRIRRSKLETYYQIQSLNTPSPSKYDLSSDAILVDIPEKDLPRYQDIQRQWLGMQEELKYLFNQQ